MVRFVSLLQILMLTNSIHSLVFMFYFGGYLRILPIFLVTIEFVVTAETSHINRCGLHERDKYRLSKI